MTIIFDNDHHTYWPWTFIELYNQRVAANEIAHKMVCSIIMSLFLPFSQALLIYEVDYMTYLTATMTFDWSQSFQTDRGH